MSIQIIQQPDGKLAVYSTIVSDWIHTGKTAQELEDIYAEEAAEDARSSIRRITGAVLAGDARKVYHQFAMTFEQAEKQIRSGLEAHKEGDWQ
jgi:hypothetical protein